MKKYIQSILWIGVVLLAFNLTACNDYLDKEVDSSVSPKEAFKNFNNFQGYTEELYHCIPDFAKGYWTNSFNWGEDEITTTSIDYHFVNKVDNGDFWGWQSRYDGWNSGWMDRRNSVVNTNADRLNKALWAFGWYGIRKANIGLENLDKLTEATDEEKRLIKGQLLFFRGWFHFQFMQYFGGLPYVDKALSTENKLTLPRLSYQETADRAAQDFREAADLLPIDWDNTTAGKKTLGKNQLRINKIMALGYLGKDYLWAASPLMNYESNQSKTYDEEYCKKAAAAFAELLNLVESGKTQYALVDFSKYSNLFYTNGQGWKMPGETEAIFRGPSYDPNGSNWGLSKQYQPGGILVDENAKFFPTANYVNYYGMANGLPLTDAGSGFDSEKPWYGRDPRFYHDIVYDGVKCVDGTITPAENEKDRYANLYTGGSYRDIRAGSRTGYMLYKFIPIRANKYDDGYSYGSGNHIHISWMRLADIYLMYAEAAANGYNSVQGQVAGYDKTAIDAVNIIRTRAGVGPVDNRYLGSMDAFMAELQRERAVELAYEGHRFNDLRRWMLLTERPYTLKTSQEFDRAAGFNSSKPKENKVLNFKETVILERQFSSKHYWLPLKNVDVHMYLEFPQNPGW